MNPYEVLGVDLNAGPELIKSKYRELIKKYHPDKVIGAPEEKMYEEKTKQLNEAYDILTKKSAYGKSIYSGMYHDPTYQHRSHTTQGNKEIFDKVRRCIEMGDLINAQNLLKSIPIPGAEWYYLRGVILKMGGFYNSSKEYFARAYKLEPQNPEYTRAFAETASYEYASFYTRSGKTVNTGRYICCDSD